MTDRTPRRDALNRYRFRGSWHFDAPPAAVLAVLDDPARWPEWWPQIRSVDRLTADSGTVEVHSLLPLTLRLGLDRLRRDPAAGELAVRLTGDLDGTAAWRITADGRGCRVALDQRVTVRRPLMRALALPARPLFRLNHALMMRSFARGLAARLRTPGGTYGRR